MLLALSRITLPFHQGKLTLTQPIKTLASSGFATFTIFLSFSLRILPAFLPGKDQESGGIIQAGRALLDAIVDLRTPRFLVLVRNAFGGAYAAFNSFPCRCRFRRGIAYYPCGRYGAGRSGICLQG